VKLLAEWFWTDRWTGSSAFMLSAEARGVYREMLTQAWRREARLPNDHEAIQRVCGLTQKEWKRCWPRISPYWRVDGDSLVNDTQLEVYAEATGFAQRASDRGKRGAQARAQARAQVTTQAQAEHNSPISVTVSEPLPERSPGEARHLAFSGKRLEVPKFLDEEFVRRLNGQYFDLTDFYLSLEQRLAQTGEAYDIRWIREQFAAESPKPVRIVRTDERPITAKERESAERVRRNSWANRCRHEPPCETAAGCVAEIIRELREREVQSA
jgi:uncharacterized protein YdaU (DUF1376 family)